MNPVMSTRNAAREAPYTHRWTTAKAVVVPLVALPLSVWTIYMIDENLVLDSESHFRNVQIAALINTAVLTIFHYLIKWFWSGIDENIETKKLREKREIVQNASHAHDSAVKTLDKAISDVKIASLNLEEKTKGTARAIKELEATRKQQEEDLKKHQKNRDDKIDELTKELKKIDGYATTFIETEFKNPRPDVKKIRKQINDDFANTNKDISDSENKIKSLTHELSDLESAHKDLTRAQIAAQGQERENQKKKIEAALNKSSITKKIDDLTKKQNDLDEHITSLKTSKSEAENAFNQAENEYNAYKDKKDTLLIYNTYGKGPDPSIRYAKETGQTTNSGKGIPSFSGMAYNFATVLVGVPIIVKENTQDGQFSHTKNQLQFKDFQENELAQKGHDFLVHRKEKLKQLLSHTKRTISNLILEIDTQIKKIIANQIQPTIDEKGTLLVKWSSIFKQRIKKIKASQTKYLCLHKQGSEQWNKINNYYEDLLRVSGNCLLQIKALRKPKNNKISTENQQSTNLGDFFISVFEKLTSNQFEDDFEISYQDWNDSLNDDTASKKALVELEQKYKNKIYAEVVTLTTSFDTKEKLSKANTDSSNIDKKLQDLFNWKNTFSRDNHTANFEEIEKLEFSYSEELKKKNSLKTKIAPISTILDKMANPLRDIQQEEQKLKDAKSTKEKDFDILSIKHNQLLAEFKSREQEIAELMAELDKSQSVILNNKENIQLINNKIETNKKLTKEKNDKLTLERQDKLKQHEKSSTLKEALKLMDEENGISSAHEIFHEAKKKYDEQYDEKNGELAKLMKSAQEKRKELETAMDNSVKDKEIRSENTNKAFCAHRESIKALDDEAISIARLAMHRAIIKKCEKAGDLYATKIATPQKKNTGKKIVTEMLFDCLDKKIHLALLKMRNHSIQYSRGKQETEEEWHRLFATDNLRLLLAQQKLKRHRIAEEWRVLRVGAEEISNGNGELLKLVGETAQKTKRQELLEALKEEKKLIDAFFYAKPYNEKTKVQFIIARLNFIFDEIKIESADYKTKDHKFYGSSITEILKDKLQGTDWIVSLNKDHLSFFQELNKVANNQKKGFGDYIEKLFTNKTNIISKTLTKQPRPNIPNLYDDYVTQRDGYKKSKYELKMECEILEQKYYNEQKQTIKNYKSTEWVPPSVKFSLEKISYLAPIVLLFFAYYYKHTSFQLSFGISRNVLLIESMTHLFVQAVFPKRPLADEDELLLRQI